MERKGLQRKLSATRHLGTDESCVGSLGGLMTQFDAVTGAIIIRGTCEKPTQTSLTTWEKETAV